MQEDCCSSPVLGIERAALTTYALQTLGASPLYASRMPETGEVFAEKYLIERVLGQGGMGIVYAARHIRLHERVAIKMLLPEAAVQPDVVERFLREARAAIRIKSPHCVRVLDVGSIAGGVHYIVMEYLEGDDLAGVLKKRGPLRPATVVDWTLEACEAVAEAHALQIVHRDLKPSNLFLARVGQERELVKVLDFGISKSVVSSPGEMAMTKTSAILGSPLYMSPEQLVSSKNVDARSDIWAFGVILFELLTGDPPFMAETLPALGALVLSGIAPRANDRRRDVSAELSAVVATCLRKNASDRFANLADLALALAPFGTAQASASAKRIVQLLGMPTARASIDPSITSVMSGPVGSSALASSVAMGDGGARSNGRNDGALPSRPNLAESAHFALAATENASPPNARRSGLHWIAAPVIAVLLVIGSFAGWRLFASRTNGDGPPAAGLKPSIATSIEATPVASSAAVSAVELPSASAFAVASPLSPPASSSPPSNPRNTHHARARASSSTASSAPSPTAPTAPPALPTAPAAAHNPDRATNSKD